MTSLKLFFLSVVVFAFLDAIWLGYVMSSRYKAWLGPLARHNPDGSLNINFAAAICVYLLLAAAMVFFVLPRTAGLPPLSIFLIGAFMGLIIYGVYDFTNAATLSRWPLSLILADVAWSAFATGVTAYAVTHLGKMFGWL